MKISELIKREPFERIFRETMVLFLNDLTGVTHKVSWRDKKYLQSLSDSKQYWYCNPLINSIFVKRVKPDVFNSINGEYQHNPLRPWRSIFQRLYLLLSQSELTSVYMSKYMVTISPSIKNAENKLIIGGNTKIRIIDIDRKIVYVILKSGFDKKYMEREVYVRANLPYLPIPKINEYGNHSLWHQESYVVGRSPNRMDQDAGRSALFKAVKYIHRMLNETKREESVSQYVAAIKGKIDSGLHSVSYINVKIKNDIQAIVSALIKHLKEYPHNLINTAHCHGDFHQGNILSDGNNDWIVDWEYSERKQIGYDLFMSLLESRMVNGFSSRFLKLMNNQFDDNQKELANNWPGINWDDSMARKVYLTVFLLEDVCFHIDEINNNIFYKDPDILASYLNELKKIIYNSF